MRKLLLSLALIMPSIIQAQPAQVPMETRVEMVGVLIKLEREVWGKANGVLGMAYQGLQEDAEVVDWKLKCAEILKGKPIKATVRNYLVGRWKARHEAITIRYPGAATEQQMRMMFTEEGWAKYKEWQQLCGKIIMALDNGTLEV